MSDTNQEQPAETATAPVAAASATPIVFKEATLTSSEKKKLKKQKRNLNRRVKTEHGFVYLGHIPHGFFETEIKSYFSQFGRVVRLRLARSLRTGNHKGYGFVEFENVEVARIAAETMNNYLMFNKILKCHLIPKEKLHKLTFKNAKRPFHVRLASKLRQRFNATKSADKLKQIETRNKNKMEKRQTKLKELGINLDLSKLMTTIKAEKPAAAASAVKVKSSPVSKTPVPKTLEVKSQKPTTKAATAKPAVAKSQPAAKPTVDTKTKPTKNKSDSVVLAPTAKKLKSKK